MLRTNKNKKYIVAGFFASLLFGSFLLPVWGVFAQGTNPALTNLSSVIIRFQNILNLIIPFLVGLAVFIIIYGILGYISQAADEERRAEARNFILWGVVAVFIMLSVWGLVTILINTFDLNNSNAVVQDTYKTGAVPDLPKDNATIIDLIARISAIGPYVISLLMGIAVFIVIYGILRYIREGANEEKRAEGRMFIIWGITSIFLMLSIWGMVNVLLGTFKFDNSVPPIKALPTLPIV